MAPRAKIEMEINKLTNDLKRNGTLNRIGPQTENNLKLTSNRKRTSSYDLRAFNLCLFCPDLQISNTWEGYIILSKNENGNKNIPTNSQ